jgi:hypothetical protein
MDDDPCLTFKITGFASPLYLNAMVSAFFCFRQDQAIDGWLYSQWDYEWHIPLIVVY